MSNKNRKSNASAKAKAKTKEDKDKKIVDALKRSKGKKAAKKSPKKTIDKVTMELLRKPGGMTLNSIHKALLKDFPGHDSDVLKQTTKRRLHGYLQAKHGVNIKKDDNGKYSIVNKKKKVA
jgi:hypothetical protein